ncbi:MAG: HAD-IIIA family hydrolase [Clostridia bacterium]|nr:HAD-IIIA family hydrolase [Clostridia bacterium]
MNKAVFWDLQGTLGGNPVSNIKDFEPYPFAREALERAKDMGFFNIVVTNQSGIAKGLLTVEEYGRKRDRILAYFNSDRILIDDFLCCPHSRDMGCRCKKPKTGLIDDSAKKYDLDVSSCFVIGDMGMSDIVMAKNVGCPGILVLTGGGRGSLGEFRDTWKDCEADYIAENALEAVMIIGGIINEQ